MSTTPTNNPIPSESPKDLAFNAGKIDEFINSPEEAFSDRFGLARLTLTGIQAEADNIIGSLGFVPVDSFEAGATITSRNQSLHYLADNNYYRWDGALPKVVAPGSTPASSGGVASGAWVNATDNTLRSDLLSGGKASLVGYGTGTVGSTLDALVAKTGFDKVGRFLNVSDLRSVAPTSTGQVVYCASAASASATEVHYGGGFFESFNNVTTPIADDGGIVIVPSIGTMAWMRINFTDVELVFWGVKPDTGLDYSAQILKAMTYVRAKQCTIKFPRGVVTSNEALPVWSNSKIVGEGREISQFMKLTNNGWALGGGVSVDALCVCLPDTYNPSGYTMDTFCVRPQIKGISLRRGSLTFANKAQYGIWGHKLASAKFSDMLILGSNYGFYGINCFLMIQEQVDYSGYVGSYAGVFISNILSGSYGRSGTTCLFTQVGTQGYNFGFFLAGLDSTKLVQCTAGAISRSAGETRAAAYNWINPMNCMMDCCYTEVVDGSMLAATNSNTVSIINTLVVNSFNITPGDTFTQPTPLMDIGSGGLGPLYVTFIGGDLRNNFVGAGNMTPPIAAGANCVVKLLGAVSNQWNTSGGATVTTI